MDIISKTKQVQNALISLGISSDKIIILPGNTTSTIMEAMIIRDYICKQTGIDTLTLISSASHTRRSSMIFKAAFRKAGIPVHVFCMPSTYSKFDAEKWWNNKDGFQTVIMEYSKIANFVLFEKRQLSKGIR